MKKSLKIFILGLISLSIIFLWPREDKFSYEVDEKYYSKDQSIYENDFDYIFDFLEKFYPLFERNKTKDFLNKRVTYKKSFAYIKDRDEFMERINEVLGDLKDPHTRILGDDELSEIIKTYKLFSKENPGSINMDLINYLEEGLGSVNIIKNTYAASSNLKVMDINDQLAYIRVRSMLTTESEVFKKDLEIIKAYLKKSKDKKALIIDLRGNSGGDSSYFIDYLYPLILGNKTCKSPEEVILYRSDGVFKYDPQYEAFKDHIEKISKDDLSYLMENIGFLNDDRALREDIKENFSYILKLGGYKNTGALEGENELDTYQFKGRLYLLIDRYTYSSAEKAAIFFRENKLGKILGEKSGGDGIGTSPALVRLPNTGLVLRMSHQLGLIDSSTRQGSIYTEPDIYVDRSTFMANPIEDGCVKKIIEIEGLLQNYE